MCVRAGANAVGFVFAESPRRTDSATAGEIARHLHPSVTTVGVFVDASPGEILATVSAVGLDAVQLQGAEPEETVTALREARPGLFIVRARRVTTPSGVTPELLDGGDADALMVDSKDASRPAEGLGSLPVSWLSGLRHPRLIVAGGLTPATVGEIVARVRPWGVDVSSGVEAAPGRKDLARIRDFVHAVRAAEATRAAVRLP